MLLLWNCNYWSILGSVPQNGFPTTPPKNYLCTIKYYLQRNWPKLPGLMVMWLVLTIARNGAWRFLCDIGDFMDPPLIEFNSFSIYRSRSIICHNILFIKLTNGIAFQICVACCDISNAKFWPILDLHGLEFNNKLMDKVLNIGKIFDLIFFLRI